MSRTKDMKMEAIRRLMVEYGMIGNHDFAMAVLEKLEAIDNMNSVVETRYLQMYAVSVPIEWNEVRRLWASVYGLTLEGARKRYVQEQHPAIVESLVKAIKDKNLVEIRNTETEIIGTLYIYQKPTNDEKERT